ncbi:MAG: Gfo/Idh/MocA family oxidoreductase [Clostridia bacterium]|nr:Gfo/Idh/MocA family oxidoreductase [Clostridia bacterium]
MRRTMHVGVVGLGHRGPSMTNLLSSLDGVRVDMVCDLYEDRVSYMAKWLKDNRGYEPVATTNYDDLVNNKELEAIFIFSSWEAHIPQAVAAMKAGKWVAMEVGGAYSVKQCWDLVRTSEETGMPVAMLENCCYGKRELMVANMAAKGALGKIVHCEGGYRHYLCDEIADGEKIRHYRLRNYLNRNCHNYPTHDFGPIAKILGINRGNRPVSLVSVASGAFGMKEYIKEQRPEYTHLQDAEFAQGDVVTTIIKCAHGETVTLTLDTTLPRFYSRDFAVQGTRGMYEENSDSIYLEGRDLPHGTEINRHCGNAKDFEEEFLSPKWRPENADKVKGGHGGMDGLCLDAFLDKLAAGDKDLDIDVYDAAVWMAITALSEQSLAAGGVPVAFPDFTNGAWITREPRHCDDFS